VRPAAVRSHWLPEARTSRTARRFKGFAFFIAVGIAEAAGVTEKTEHPQRTQIGCGRRAGPAPFEVRHSKPRVSETVGHGLNAQTPSLGDTWPPM